MEPAEGARRPCVLQPGEAALHDTAEAWRRGSVRKRKALPARRGEPRVRALHPEFSSEAYLRIQTSSLRTFVDSRMGSRKR